MTQTNHTFEISSETVDQFQRELLQWSDGKLRSYPWRKSEDPYEILIAEFLLQRTQADNVEPIYNKLINEYPDFERLSQSTKSDLVELLRPLGLQNKRGDALFEIASRLKDGSVPMDKDVLKELPQVGPYGSNAILCFAFGEREPILDQNVIRIYERLFGIELDHRKDEAWSFADQLLPESEFERYNLSLLDFAASVCTPDPNCEDCFASDYCAYYCDNG